MRNTIRGIVAVGGVVGIAGAASAADLYSPPPPMVTPLYAQASAYDWSGFYAGVNGGWGWGSTTASTGSAFNIPISGGILGAQAGYNFMLTNNIVAGIEGDISWSGMKGTVTPGPTVTQNLGWLGTIRGRVGVAMNTVMPYITAGFAAGSGTRTTTASGGESANATHTGYVLGAGVEWAFAQNWTAKLEYQYVSLGARTYTFAGPPSPAVSMSNSIVRVGLNYKF